MSRICMYEPKILKERKLFLLFISLSIVPPLFSLFEFLMPATENFSTWFQRSGSIMVVFALLAEMRAYNMTMVLKPGVPVEPHFTKAKSKYSWQIQLSNISAFTLIAFGTLIWGYGDIPFK